MVAKVQFNIPGKIGFHIWCLLWSDNHSSLSWIRYDENGSRQEQNNYRTVEGSSQKYSRLRCLGCVKGLVICFYLGWSGSIIQFRQDTIKVGSKSWLLICSSNITLSLPSYNGSALKRVLNFCNDYFSLLHFCRSLFRIIILRVQNVNRIFPLRMLTLADSNKMSKNSSW